MKKFYLSNMHKKLFGFLFLLMSFGVWGQNTMVNYQFNNNLNPDAGAIGSPVLEYFNSSHTPIIPATYSNNMLSSETEGNYLLLSIDATGHQSMTVSFDADFRAAFILGSWNVEANTGAGNAWQNIGSLDLWSIFNITISGSGSFNLPIAANNKSDLKIRITSNFGTIGSARLRLDNLRLTSGVPNITVYTNSNYVIPHDSEASESYNTVFGNLQTYSTGELKTYRIRNYYGTPGSLLNVSSIIVEPSSGTTPNDFVIESTNNLTGLVRVTSNSGTSSLGMFSIRFIPQAEGVRSALIKVYSNGDQSPYVFQVIGGGRSCNIANTAYVRNTIDNNAQTLESDLTVSDFVAGQSNSPIPTTIFSTFYPNSNSNPNPLYVSASSSWYTKENEKVRTFGGDGVDVSNLRNVSIEFSLAAFANSNSTTRGVNYEDYIILSVNEGGVWRDIMKLQGSNQTWFSNPSRKYTFNASGKIFEKNYNHSLTTVENTGENTGTNGTNGNAYAKFKLNIPLSVSSQMTNLRFRIRAKANENAVWLIDDVQIKSDNAEFKTYTAAGTWSPSGNPTSNQKVVIEGNYTVPNAGLNICECEVMEGGSLTVPSGRNMTVRGKITNHNATGDNFIVANNANLIQIEDAAANIGDIKVEKLFTFVNGPVPANDRKQYNFVTSPVVGQNIKTIYPGNPNVIEYRESNNFFYNHSGDYTAGKGFGIKEPSKSAVSGTTVTANFRGIPFNGELIYPLARTNPGNPDYGFNLIGNPYPSNLDIQLLYNNNSTVIEPTFYFWDNRGNTEYTQQGSEYGGSNYAIYNAVSGTGNGTGEAAGGAPDNSRIPNRYVKVGTGFMVQAISPGQSIRFTNAYRSADNSGPAFFGKYMNQNSFAAEHAADINTENESEKDRYWLTLTTMSGMEFMNAVVYFDEGNNEYAADDSDAMGASDEIFTLVGQQYLAINGRAPFENTDVVPLGVRHFAEGKFIIDIHTKEGVFANGQKIYLKDNYLNKLHELTLGYYEYESESGEFIDRFEILYKNPGVTDPVFTASNLNHLKISKENHHIMIDSSIDKITAVEIFNLSGWSIYKKDNVNSQEHKVAAQSLGKGIIIVNVITEKGEVVSRKFINN